ncbi:hypothetical protein SSP531S_14150 [Streptomyces spongiicola]|uniref:Uncharacterized protein n=1 Tax=Streptomyces spongiicola TaxID=1690221 RepID=A0A388STW5_9ACTN|nr:hypothetical protein SSP531S_14150 [Streptomyces spongiicola]
MMRNRPGSVVAAARSRDEVSAQALSRAGGPGDGAGRPAEGRGPGPDAGPDCAGTCGTGGAGGPAALGMCVN